MVHLGLGGQYLQEGDSAYLFPVNQADVEIQTRKIVSVCCYRAMLCLLFMFILHVQDLNTNSIG